MAAAATPTPTTIASVVTAGIISEESIESLVDESEMEGNKDERRARMRGGGKGMYGGTQGLLTAKYKGPSGTRTLIGKSHIVRSSGHAGLVPPTHNTGESAEMTGLCDVHEHATSCISSTQRRREPLHVFFNGPPTN